MWFEHVRSQKTSTKRSEVDLYKRSKKVPCATALPGILGSQKRDLRQRRFFGDAKVWIPNLPQSEEYLNTVYGEDSG
jgi:hypothetical protein